MSARIVLGTNRRSRCIFAASHRACIPSRELASDAPDRASSLFRHSTAMRGCRTFKWVELRLRPGRRVHAPEWVAGSVHISRRTPAFRGPSIGIVARGAGSVDRTMPKAPAHQGMARQRPRVAAAVAPPWACQRSIGVLWPVHAGPAALGTNRRGPETPAVLYVSAQRNHPLIALLCVKTPWGGRA
jgi:hypothetical protein